MVENKGIKDGKATWTPLAPPLEAMVVVVVVLFYRSGGPRLLYLDVQWVNEEIQAHRCAHVFTEMHKCVQSQGTKYNLKKNKQQQKVQKKTWKSKREKQKDTKKKRNYRYHKC